MSIGQILGAGIGFLIGGPTGAKWGFMIGGWLDQPKQPDQIGPRLQDLSVQTSQEGAPLPMLFGTMRLAGNVIWSTGLEEIKHVEDIDGGSGGGGGQSITFTYRTDVALALCVGEITGIRRVWADSKLIYDIGDSADYTTLTASTSRAKSLRVYSGSETQLPDPLIEAVEGVGAAPAFRGVAYLVFEDLELADFGNRIPNFTCEVVKTGAADNLNLLSSSSGPPNGGTVIAVKRKAGELTKVTVFRGALGWNGVTYPHLFEWWYLLPDNTWVFREAAYIHHIGIYNWNSLGYSEIEDYDDDSFILCYPASNSKAFLVTMKGGTLRFWKLHYSSSANYRNFIGRDYIAYTTWSDIRISKRDQMAEVTPTMGSWGGYYGYGINGTLLAEEQGHLATIGLYGEHYRSSVCVVDDQLHVMTHISPTNTVFHIPLDQFELTPGATWVYTSGLTYTSEQQGACLGSSMMVAHGGTDLLYMLGSTCYVCDADYNWRSLGACPASVDMWGLVDQVSPYVYAGYTSAGKEQVLSYGLLTPASEALDEVAEALAVSAGVTSYNMSALSSDVVRGYVVARPMPMRSALEPLMATYHFDLAEVDGVLVAVKRGGASVDTWTTDDLGAGESATNTMTVTRQNVVELPSRVEVSFIDVEADYQPGLQYARRITAQHENVLNVQLPIALSTQEAARVAETQLNIAWWTGQYSVETSVDFSHLRLAPADIVTAPVRNTTANLRLLEILAGAPGIMQIKAVPDLPSLYSGAAVGADAVDLAQVLHVKGPMRLVLLDCVLLRDKDNSVGLYMAGGGYVSTWPSGVVMKSTDNGASYAQIAVVQASAIASIGSALAALPDVDCRVWDNSSVLSVRMLAGATLSSATESSVLNGANAALLGAHGRWELLQFKTATLQGDGSYQLTNLLRGRKGTEFAASQHTTYDTFVLLSPTTVQNISVASTDVGAARQYKGVTSGQALEDADTTTLTLTAERLECLAPVLLGGGRDSSGNITINWTRRDRLNADWLNNADVPMSEASESYEVDIYTNNTYATVKRTLTGITSPTTNYTSANQVTDFGSNQSTVYLRVYQLSATNGRGHYLQGSV